MAYNFPDFPSVNTDGYDFPQLPFKTLPIFEFPGERLSGGVGVEPAFLKYIAFSSESELVRYINGESTDPEGRSINDQLQLKTFYTLCIFITGDEEISLRIILSSKLQDALSACAADFYQKVVDRTPGWIASLGPDQKGIEFKCSLAKIKAELINAIPRGGDKLAQQEDYTKAQALQYDINYHALIAAVDNPKDSATRNAIILLCKTIVSLSDTITKMYNRQLDLNYDAKFLGLGKKLTLNDLRAMLDKLKSVSLQIRQFHQYTFNDADSIIAYFNKNLLDTLPSAEVTKFILSFPLEGLPVEKRLNMLNLLLDGKERLSFSGFWRKLSSDKVTRGDIVFTLFTTATDQDVSAMLPVLQKGGKLVSMLSAADNDFLINTIPLLSRVAALDTYSSPDKYSVDYQRAIENQSFFFYDSDSSKKQSSGINTESNTITLTNNGYRPDGWPTSKYSRDSSDEAFEEYKKAHVSIKEAFNPLEMVILTAESNLKYTVLQEVFGMKDGVVKKDDICLVPAMVIYIMLAELEKEWETYLFWTVVAIALLPLGIAPLIAAIEAGSVIGVIVAATDVAVDVTVIGVNDPDYAHEHPEVTQAVNYAAFFYGLARISYAGLKRATSGEPPNLNLLKALKALKASGKKLIAGSGGELKFIKVLSRNVLKQEERMSCAAACIRQFAKDKGIIMTEEGIRKLAKTTASGTSHDGIKSAMSEIFKDKVVHAGCAYHEKLTSEQIASIFSKNDSWIAIVKPENGIRHTVIVDKIVGKNVYIRDPWPIEEFMQGTNGVEGIIKLNDFIQAWQRGEQYFARFH